MVAKKELLRCIAIFVIINFTFQIVAPTAFAMSNGPTQPEATGFTPASVDDLVDPFTGDFTYNIPLLDVEGYPVNLSYAAGVGMEDEASWVGLGWMLNPGVVNRAVRGVPDDFNGDIVSTEKNMRKNKTVGMGATLSTELFGFNFLSTMVTLGLNFNNYNGFGASFGFTPLQAGFGAHNQFSAGLGINSSSADGLSVQPSVSFSARDGNTFSSGELGGITVGTSFSRRGGLASVGIQPSIKSINRAMSTSTVNAGFSANLALTSHLPRANSDYQSFAVSGQFTLGAALFGFHPNTRFSAYFSKQQLAEPSISSPSYGYLYLHNSNNEKKDLTDYLRRNEYGYSTAPPALPTSSQTYDIYSVNAQGVSGSYRPFRNKIGASGQNSTKTTSSTFDIGVELGALTYFHGGVNIEVIPTVAKTGQWLENNQMANALAYGGPIQNSASEHMYFKEASEKSALLSADHLENIGGFSAVRPKLDKSQDFNVKVTNLIEYSGVQNEISPLVTNEKVNRNKSFQYFTKAEVANSFGAESMNANAFAAQGSHVSEIDINSEDGSQYVFGLPAYNVLKEEVTFAVGNTLHQSNAPLVDYQNELVFFSSGEDTPNGNTRGRDHYVNKVTTPPHASSYLLTSVLGKDYIDSDDQKGPSDGDIGNYVKFGYTKTASNHKWRSPYTSESGYAGYDRGLRSDIYDDKATYIYGEKELWYLGEIKTKNYIAIFVLDDEIRLDGYEAAGPAGGRGTNVANQLQKLKRIDLYTRKDYDTNASSAIPIKSVHFEYNYELCPGVPSNSGIDPNNTGKLTLKKVYFTYRNSNRAKYNAYEFNYAHPDTPYDRMGTDRWGTYTENTGNDQDPATFGPPTSRYPYSNQNESLADAYAAAWNLNNIKTPTGSLIEIEYESDAYGYVQHRKAEKMYKLTKPGDGNFDISNPNQTFDFEFDNPEDLISDYYVHIGDLVYGNFLVRFGNGPGENFEYVPGYFKVESITSAGPGMGRIKFAPVTRDDGTGPFITPVSKAALQFGRLQMSSTIFNATALNIDAGFGLEILQAFLTTFTNLIEIFQTPHQIIYSLDRCKEAVAGQSWVKMVVPDGEKYGGGHRVSKVVMRDGWDAMTGSAESGSFYGKTYQYVGADGRCSGVAQNEPAMGYDECVLREPVFTDEKAVLAPDNRFYMETPFCDDLFPNPSVGYSRIVISDYTEADENDLPADRHGTGATVHSFYTARDFPVFQNRTPLDDNHDKTHALSLQALLGIQMRDFVAYSQGFAIETNDMHGKQKKIEYFSQTDGIVPIKYTEYQYKHETRTLDGIDVLALVNDEITTIDENGEVRTNEQVGIFYEMFSDSHEERSKTTEVSVLTNVDVFPWIWIPWVWTVIKPQFSYSGEEREFRYITLTKELKRFGILENVREFNEGTFTDSENLAYDRTTGEALITRTVNNFDDNYYSISYPAYWHFSGMGPSSKTLGNRLNNLFALNGFVQLQNASNIVALGDEIMNSSGIRYWVSEVGSNHFKIINKAGNAYTGALGQSRVVKSGNKNMIGEKMMTIQSLMNPLSSFENNQYEGVLSASATKFGNRWRAYCDCFGDGTTEDLETTNPYVLGNLGKWHPLASYTYLTDRSASDYNRNTNIRKDGVLQAFNPMFKTQDDQWVMNESGWTFVSEIVEFSPEGFPLETKDAIGNFSSSIYAYNRSMQTAVASNSERREIGFLDFEFTDDMDCGNRHFYVDGGVVNNAVSHSGNHSVIVTPSNPASAVYQLGENCPDEPICTLDYDYSPNILNIYNDNIETVEIEILSGNVNTTIFEPYSQIGFDTTTGSGGLVKIYVTTTDGCLLIEILPVIAN